MLVLTRKLGESIRIGDDIIIEVLAIQGKRVKLGLRGPRCIPIVREEICQGALVPDSGEWPRAGHGEPQLEPTEGGGKDNPGHPGDRNCHRGFSSSRRTFSGRD